MSKKAKKLISYIASAVLQDTSMQKDLVNRQWDKVGGVIKRTAYGYGLFDFLKQTSDLVYLMKRYRIY